MRMDRLLVNPATESSSTPNSSTGSLTSPTVSMWSRGHSAKSSASSTSIASSPIPRESFDLYMSSKRLEDVREEPQEREDDLSPTDVNKHYSFDDYVRDSLHILGSSPNEQSHMEYSLSDQDSWSMTSSGHHQPKRQRSVNSARHSMTQGFANRFGSISRRWKTRSAIGPQLSIVTHTAPTAKSVSTELPSQIMSPALSAISKHESYLLPSPIGTTVDEESTFESNVGPIAIEQNTSRDEELEPGQATTPLLPPVMAQLNRQDSPIQSPLQSPSIAPTPYATSARVSMDTPPVSMLPSPPLSTRPSVASIHRSRANTATTAYLVDVPALRSLDETSDPWSLRLGHADFSVHPEPYLPETIDLETYREFRDNWEQARKQYAQHLARTIEHYGETSKIFRWTEEKWKSIDDVWKRNDSKQSAALKPALARLSDHDAASPDTPSDSCILDKPATRVVIPQLDHGGKFPELGDSDIVGPLSVGPAKVVELQRGQPTPPQSPRKRTLVRYLSDVFKHH